MSTDRTTVYWYPAGDTDLPAWITARDWVQIEGNERDPDAPLPVFLNLAKSSDGRTICAGMIVGKLAPFSAGPSEVTSRALRAIPISDLIETAISSGELPDSYGAAVRALVEGAPRVAVPKRRPGPNGLSDEYLKMVAAYYRASLEAAPGRPMQWLVEQLDRSEATVRRHVQRARDKGFLGASTPGKAGERSTGEGGRS